MDWMEMKTKPKAKADQAVQKKTIGSVMRSFVGRITAVVNIAIAETGGSEVGAGW